MTEAQKQLIKETKSREEKIRNDTIDEYRKKQLLELDLPISHPLEYMGLWDGQYHNGGRSGGSDGRTVVKIDDKDKRVKFDSYIKQLTNTGNYVNNNINKADDNDDVSGNNDDQDNNNDNITNNSSIKKPFIESVGIIQRAIDSEMSAADEVVSKMRSLRTGLGMIYYNAVCCRSWV